MIQKRRFFLMKWHKNYPRTPHIYRQTIWPSIVWIRYPSSFEAFERQRQHVMCASHRQFTAERKHNWFFYIGFIATKWRPENGGLTAKECSETQKSEVKLTLTQRRADVNWKIICLNGFEVWSSCTVLKFLEIKSFSLFSLSMAVFILNWIYLTWMSAIAVASMANSGESLLWQIWYFNEGGETERDRGDFSFEFIN